MIAEGTEKDEGNFNMENDENGQYCMVFLGLFFSKRRLIKHGNCLLIQVNTTDGWVVTFSVPLKE